MMPVDRIKTNCLGGGVEGLPTDHQQGNSDSITAIQFRLQVNWTSGTWGESAKCCWSCICHNSPSCLQKQTNFHICLCNKSQVTKAQGTETGMSFWFLSMNCLCLWERALTLRVKVQLCLRLVFRPQLSYLWPSRQAANYVPLTIVHLFSVISGVNH